MSLPAKYKLTLTTPTGMRSEESGTISAERYAVLCGVLSGKLPDDLAALQALEENNASLHRRVRTFEKLLARSASALSSLADSLGNACEFFEGEADEDPQAVEECNEARELAALIAQELPQ